MFDRFYRSPGGDRGVPGTGLGLSIVKSLVDLHEGVVEVGSRPGRRHRLPGAAAGRRRPVPETTRELMRGRRVLIVEEAIQRSPS